MLLTTPKIQRLNYQLVHKLYTLKCKLKKGQEPSKTLCVTRISGTLDYTAPFTSVIINSYNRILKTSVKDYNSQSDIPSLIFPTNKLRNNSFNSFQSLRFLNMTNSHYCPYSGNNLDNEESIFCWSRFVSEEGRDEVIAFLRDDLGLNMDEVNTESNDFEMTLAEGSHQELENVLHEAGWVEQGDYDLDRDDEDYLNLPSIVRETIESEDKEITAKDIDNLSPEAKALYDRLKNS